MHSDTLSLKKNNNKKDQKGEKTNFSSKKKETHQDHGKRMIKNATKKITLKLKTAKNKKKLFKGPLLLTEVKQYIG